MIKTQYVRRLIFLLLSLAAILTLLALQRIIFANESRTVWHMVNCNDGDHQADCHLLQDRDVSVLVDAGDEREATRYLNPFLAENQISTISHFFISHPHTDHYGGLKSLLESQIQIENIYYNLPPDGVSDWNYKPEDFEKLLSESEEQGSKLHNISKGFELELPTSKIIVLEAKKSVQAGGVNDYSIIMRWDVKGYRNLFTGDLSSNLGLELASDPSIKTDILKVPHHGVSDIAPNSFFDRADPAIVMVPGHKTLWLNNRSRQFVEWSKMRYDQHKTLLCHNGYNGVVSLYFNEDYIDLETQRESSRCPENRVFISKESL